MTTTELWIKAAELEARADELLKSAVEKFNAIDRRTQQQEWLAASDKMVFWTDVSNGFRQAADALHALELIEKGGSAI